MAGIKFEGFQGLVPRTSPRLLGPMNATVARNTKLTSGEIRGFREPDQEADLSAITSVLGRAFRVPDTPADSWLAFASKNIDIIRSPLVNDAYDRYYWAGDGRPKMRTGDDIKNGIQEQGYWLGIPTPTSVPVVNPPPGTEETRAYVYTYVSEYGEEGPPSPPVIVTGNTAGTWEIETATTVPDSGNRNVTKKNIYRTVPGNASTSFFLVNPEPLALSTFPYEDTETNEDVASRNLLASTNFVEPPTNLEGFVVMPNGYLVGWVGKRLVFSEPYRPHAWPAEYELATEFPIVGLGVVGATLVVCTESQPYFGQGVTPESFTMQKLDAIVPCLSRRSIVSTTAGVVYASVDGLALANSAGVNVVTKDLFTKKEWRALSPETIFAAALNLQYIAFNAPNFGFIIDPENPMQRHVELDNFADVEGIETDRYTGDVLILSNGRVYNWDPESVIRLNWRWKSKIIQTPKPVNFGAVRVKFDVGDISQALPVETLYRPYNELLFSRISALSGSLRRLNTLNGAPLGGSPAQPQLGLVPEYPSIIETRQPLGGSLLYDLSFLQLVTASVRLRIYIQPDSEVESVIFDKQIFDESIIRLPTGFKSDLWAFELIGNTNVYSMQVAETPNELAEI